MGRLFWDKVPASQSYRFLMQRNSLGSSTGHRSTPVFMQFDVVQSFSNTPAPLTTSQTEEHDAVTDPWPLTKTF